MSKRKGERYEGKRIEQFGIVGAIKGPGRKVPVKEGVFVRFDEAKCEAIVRFDGDTKDTRVNPYSIRTTDGRMSAQARAVHELGKAKHVKVVRCSEDDENPYGDIIDDLGAVSGSFTVVIIADDVHTSSLDSWDNGFYADPICGDDDFCGADDRDDEP